MERDPADVLQQLTATWEDADTLDALDELAAQQLPDPEKPRTREERAAERAAREDWKRTEPAA